MADFLFTFKRPELNRFGRTKIKFTEQAIRFVAESDGQARARARRILKGTRLQFEGAYCIGESIVLHRFDRTGRATVVRTQA